MTQIPLRRCAVYTRKSSDEGLEQEFNSLHAQREACEAYIVSQRHEGWRLTPKAYDDGGFTGGNMERPALKALLTDVKAGLVDVVVVYKIDRLTRSLVDFTRIVEVLDSRQACFVSITQAFNTTSSMGRLTLNVLLSFAQFEREVTGERIRDKIAQSKAKGMWMGGYRPLGYAIEGRGLVPHPTEAPVIVELFERYLTCRSVDLLRDEALDGGLFDKLERRSAEPMSRGALYHLLQNPLYAGEVRHKEKRYPGLHAAIVERSLFDAVQTDLAKRRQVRASGERSRTPALLTGLVFDSEGRPYTPTHTLKGERRYTYYCIQARDAAKELRRLPARDLEQSLLLGLQRMLTSPTTLAPILAQAGVADFPAGLAQAGAVAKELSSANAASRRALVRKLLTQVVIDAGGLTLSLRGQEVFGATSDPSVTISLPLTLARRGADLKLAVGADGAPPRSPDPHLVSAIAKGSHWLGELMNGSAANREEIATRHGISAAYVGQLIELAFLAPDLKAEILEGRQPRECTISSLKRLCPLPLSWQQQRECLRKLYLHNS